MAGLAYIGSDNRAYIKADLFSHNRLVKSDKEFLLDPGSTQSGIDKETVKQQGFILEGIEEFDTPAGTIESIVISGATITFNVTNQADKKTTNVDCDLPLVILPRNIIGTDQLSKFGLSVTINLKDRIAMLEKL